MDMAFFPESQKKTQYFMIGRKYLLYIAMVLNIKDIEVNQYLTKEEISFLEVREIHFNNSTT